MPRKATIAVSIVGFVAALITIYIFFVPLIAERIPPWRLVRDAPSVTVVTASTVGPIVGDRVIVPAEFLTDDEVYIVANHLEFNASGSNENPMVRAPRIVVFAERVTGGILDVSGADGEGPGEAGSHGGELIVVASRLHDTVLAARGGNGGSGRDGADGRPGRDGECGPGIFGDFVGSTAGGSGENAGDGGAAGDGGRISLFVRRQGGFSASTDGGNGGAGGVGGRGGRGGSGCSGLGGNQPTRSSGPDGRDGGTGSEGRPGAFLTNEIRFAEVKRAIREIDLGNASALPERLDEILSLF